MKNHIYLLLLLLTMSAGSCSSVTNRDRSTPEGLAGELFEAVKSHDIERLMETSLWHYRDSILPCIDRSLQTGNREYWVAQLGLSKTAILNSDENGNRSREVFSEIFSADGRSIKCRRLNQPTREIPDSELGTIPLSSLEYQDVVVKVQSSHGTNVIGGVIVVRSEKALFKLTMSAIKLCGQYYWEGFLYEELKEISPEDYATFKRKEPN
ncbi:MAG: hypothetical protein ABI432_10600 [Flavobacteriales bacterium]